LLSAWVEDTDAALNTRQALVDIARSTAFPDDPWISFLIKEGIGFIPRRVKQTLLRDAENRARANAGLPAIGEGWVSEMLLGSMLRSVCDLHGLRLEHHKRFKWLGRQHLDFYIPELQMGFEFNGLQHYSPVDLFGGEGGLQRTCERDRTKQLLCAANGVSLTCVRFDEPISEEDLDRRILSQVDGSTR
jgi:hypothetical protein